jgi:diphthamide biosynthesis protein 2
MATTATATGNNTTKRAPPQLIFDDGSRVMTEESAEAEAATRTTETPASIRGSTSLEMYYEIDRICDELLVSFAKKNQDDENDSDDMLRVALQFPDELLDDSPEVCWLLEERLAPRLNEPPLIFCLGDTTVGSCCPDEVAALHLQADVLVHYGHACLSPTGTLPVIYSFGRYDLDIPTAVECILKQQQQEEDSSSAPSRKFLLLYQVGYHHAMEDLQTQLSEQGDVLVVAGQIPLPTQKKGKIVTKRSCCGGNDADASASADEPTNQQETCCGGQDTTCNKTTSEQSATASSELQEEQQQEGEEETTLRRPLVVGGLELPETIVSWEQLVDYTVLFVGDSESTSQRQYVNIILCFLSISSPPLGYWTYSPKSQSLSTSIPTALKKQLNRRFFLTQKARDAHVFGILVSNLSQQHLVEVVKALKLRIQDAGKVSYSFAVGKINPAKLANFAEIDCFVLVACREHSLLSNEREYPAPVITPLELDVALENLAWGAEAYSLDCQDVLHYYNHTTTTTDAASDEEEDEDAPYFSLVTGKYVQKTSQTATAEDRPSLDLDLEILPGKGQVTAYKSEAAKFLKQREYQGLATQAGQTEAKAAVAGQRGIASDYSGS